MGLFDKVRAKQLELGMSDAKFARHLGVSFGLWNGTRRGVVPIRHTLCVAVVRTFPELEIDVLLYMREQGLAGAVSA